MAQPFCHQLLNTLLQPELSAHSFQILLLKFGGVAKVHSVVCYFVCLVTVACWVLRGAQGYLNSMDICVSCSNFIVFPPETVPDGGPNQRNAASVLQQLLNGFSFDGGG